MSEYDIVNRGWNEIAFACKQKNKKILRECLKVRNHQECFRNSGDSDCLRYCKDLERSRFLVELFDKCMRYDDGQCLESLLPYIAARYELPVERVVDLFGLMPSSMKLNKKCFEYLVRTADNIDRHVICDYVRTPILRHACEKADDIAVGILFKYGADVNKIKYCTYATKALNIAIKLKGRYYTKSMEESLFCIVRMLLFAGYCVNENIISGTPIEVYFDNVKTGDVESLTSLNYVVRKAAIGFTENSY